MEKGEALKKFIDGVETLPKAPGFFITHNGQRFMCSRWRSQVDNAMDCYIQLLHYRSLESGESLHGDLDFSELTFGTYRSY